MVRIALGTLVVVLHALLLGMLLVTQAALAEPPEPVHPVAASTLASRRVDDHSCSGRGEHELRDLREQCAEAHRERHDS